MPEYLAVSRDPKFADVTVWASVEAIGIAVTTKTALGAPQAPDIVFISPKQARDLINALSRSLRDLS